MKRFGASQIGMLLLVTMVMVRAFFVTDLAGFKEGLIRLFTATSIPDLFLSSPEETSGDSNDFIEVMSEPTVRYAKNEVDLETVPDDLIAEQGDYNGLADQSSLSDALALFAPSGGNDYLAMADEDETEPVADVAPRDAGNTITSQLDRLFPRNGNAENF